MARKRDPQTGELLPEGITPVVSERTGVVTYRVRVTYRMDGKRVFGSKTHKSLAAAKSWRLQMQVNVDTGAALEPTSITVEEYFLPWFERRARNWSGSRQRTVLTSWEHHISVPLGHVRMQDVQRRHIQSLIDRMIAAGCSSSTARIYIVGVASLFRDAVIDGIVRVNPCHDLVYPKELPKRRPVWSVLELRRYLNELQKPEYRHGTTLRFIAATGCRIGEALALQWQDIDFDNGTVWIHRTLSSDVEGKLEPVDRTKTNADGRVIPLPLWALDALKDRRKHKGLVWPDADGEHFLPNSVRDQHLAICVRLKLKRIRVHDIRHTVGTLLHSELVDEQTIQDVLGHKDKQTTRQYVHPQLSALREGMDRVSRALGFDDSDTTTFREKKAN